MYVDETPGVVSRTRTVGELLPLLLVFDRRVDDVMVGVVGDCELLYYILECLGDSGTVEVFSCPDSILQETVESRERPSTYNLLLGRKYIPGMTWPDRGQTAIPTPFLSYFNVGNDFSSRRKLEDERGQQYFLSSPVLKVEAPAFVVV